VDQKPLLALHSPGVAPHRAVRADDAVARADDQQRVGADRGAQAVYTFDIRLQGDGETVFFDI